MVTSLYPPLILSSWSGPWPMICDAILPHFYNICERFTRCKRKGGKACLIYDNDKDNDVDVKMA